MSFIGGLFNDLTSGSPSGYNAGNLQAAGYQQYQATPQVALNMGAYGPDQTTDANAAQINMGQANQELGNQQSLISQLQAQAQGSGPNLAGQQLQQATQQNLAGQLAMAASQRGNQNPGAAQMNLANEGAAANQAAAGQAAQQRGQQQLASEQGLSSALGQVSSQQQQLANAQAGYQQNANLQNASAANNMAEFNTGSAQAGNAAQQSQYQFANNLAAQQQSNENAAIAGQQQAAQNAITSGVGGAINGAGAAGASFVPSGGGGGGGGGGSVVGGGNSNGGESDAQFDQETYGQEGGQARGGVDAGQQHLVGEAGPEALVKIPHADLAMALGGVVMPPGQTGSGEPRAQIGSNGPVLQAGQGGHPGGGGSAMARGGVVAPETHVHIHPDQIVNHPEVGRVGDGKAAVAVVPLHHDGSPKTEAMDEHVKELLMHPDFQRAVSTVVSHHADALKAAFESRRK